MKKSNLPSSKGIGRAIGIASAMLIIFSFLVSPVFAQPAWQGEWERVLAAAKKEGKVVVSVNPSAELRRALEATFKQRFGIELELILGSPRETSRRVADEYKAGVRYFDILTSTADNLMDRLMPMGAVEPLESYWILPEVKDPNNWWGGHIWTDKAKRYAYAPVAYMLDNIWYNADLVKPEEMRSYDDLLNPKWKGKIGFYDPRLGGAGTGMWSFLWITKGEDYLTKLVQQQLLIGERRPLADSLAKGKIAITIGPTYYTFQPFIKAGVPVKHLPPFKEGTFVSLGEGGPVIIKSAPHPNATKVFVNWLLSKEGQEIYIKALGQATRRLDVDTGWTPKFGVRAAKDYLTVEEFYKFEQQSEEKILTVRRPGAELARKMLP